MWPLRKHAHTHAHIHQSRHFKQHNANPLLSVSILFHSFTEMCYHLLKTIFFFHFSFVFFPLRRRVPVKVKLQIRLTGEMRAPKTALG